MSSYYTCKDSSSNFPQDSSNVKFLNSLKSATWDEAAKLVTPRNHYGAAIVPCQPHEGSAMKEKIFVAGGFSKKSEALKSIEIFDPNDKTVTESPSPLTTARYGCGSFALPKNAMCVMGGKDHEKKYLSSVELVSEHDTKLLPNVFSLHNPMAFFETAVISNKVYIFGGRMADGKDKGSSQVTKVYIAELKLFIDASNRIYPKDNVWKVFDNSFVPRHFFAAVVTDHLCWLIGGITEKGKETYGASSGKYDTINRKYNKQEFSSYSKDGIDKFSLYRTGCTGISYENYVVVMGGHLLKNSAPSTTTSLKSVSSKITSNNGHTNTTTDDTEAGALFFRTDVDSKRPTPISVNISQIHMFHQKAFKVGHTIYAIGQCKSKTPTSEIKCLNLNQFENDQKPAAIQKNEIPKEIHVQKRSTNQDAAKTNKTEEVNDELGTSAYLSAMQSSIVSNCMELDTVASRDLYSEDNLREDKSKMRGISKKRFYTSERLSEYYGSYCTNSYTTKSIGSGGYGVVYDGTDFSTGEKFAIKRVQAGSDSAIKTFRKEVELLTLIRHTNVVKLYGYHLESPNYSFLVYEYLEGGSLYDHIIDIDRRRALTYRERLQIMTDVLCALNFFHSQSESEIVLHRDIKPHNICLTKDKMAKLIDFGFARIEQTDTFDSNRTQTSMVRSPGYTCKMYAIGKFRNYVSECDIFSFGIVMVELITGTLNNKGNDKFEHEDFYCHFINHGEIVEGGVDKLYLSYDDEVAWMTNNEDLKWLCELALSCLRNTLSMRPTATSLFREISKMSTLNLGDPLVTAHPTNNTPLSDKACKHCNLIRELVPCKNKDDAHLCIQCITNLTMAESNFKSGDVPCPHCGSVFNADELRRIVPSNVYDHFICQGKQNKQLDRISEQVEHILKGGNQTASALTSLATKLCDCRCPKLVWILPQDQNMKLSKKLFAKEQVTLYFICEDSYEPVSHPVTLLMSPKILRRIAPALKYTIYLLKLVTVVLKLPWPGDAVETFADQLSLITKFFDSLEIDSLLKDDSCFDRMQSGSHITHLTEDAYRTLADNICKHGQYEWKEELFPVLDTKAIDLIKWVKPEFIERYRGVD